MRTSVVSLLCLLAPILIGAATEPPSSAVSEVDTTSNASTAPTETAEAQPARNDEPAASAAPKKRKKSASSKKKRRKAPPKKQSTTDSVLGAVGGSLSSLKEKAAAFRGEFSARYQERVRELEEQAELERLERAQLEVKRRERLEELRAEMKRRGVKGDVQDIAEAQAQAEEGAELTLSERAALIGTLLGSPAGIVGVVLGGVAGGAVGTIAEKAEAIHSAVSEKYSERLQAERDATEQQEGMVEELQSYGDVTFVEQREDPEAVDACRGELLEFIGRPANGRCADCNCKLSTAQDAWASVNLGVVVCVRCAALHRGLGVSNSRIRSLVYDRWDMPTARGLMAVGNERARDLYLGTLPASVKPPGKKAEEERLKTWIHSKYIKLKWADPEWKSSLTESRLRASKVSAATTRSRRTKTGSSKIIGKMPSLSSEG